MNKIRLDISGLTSSQSQTGSFALVLGESEGSRKLPIIIGMYEAQSIAIEIEKITPNRPLTHDLFKSFAHHFQFELKEIIVSDLREGVFFAKIVCTDGVKTIEIDSRPSDAIAIGLRFKVPIYTYEHILKEAGIEVDGDESAVESSELVEVQESRNESEVSELSKDELQKKLDLALREENYELAAKLRDELNRR